MSLSVNSRAATLVIGREGSAEVATLRWLAGGAVVSGLGRMHLSEGGKVASFDKDGVHLAGSPFEGLRAGPLLKAACSCNTLDDALSDPPVGARVGHLPID